MDIGIFDHYEEDGQLSFLGFQDYDDGIWGPEEQDVVPEEERIASGKQSGEPAGDGNVEQPALQGSGQERDRGMSGYAGIGIGSCASCGRMLLVEEQGDSYRACCGCCGVTYIQKSRFGCITEKGQEKE